MILRQHERLWVSCFNKLGLAFPMNPLFHNIVLCSLSALKFLGLDEAVQQGVQVVQGEAGVHAPVILHFCAGLGLDTYGHHPADQHVI